MMTAFTLVREDDAIPDGLHGAVLAIGNFDGVHRGHQELVARARAMADACGAPAAVLTFSPHPRAFFAPDKSFFRITPQRERVQVMSRLGLDGVIIRRFDAALAATPAIAFLERFIRDEIAARGVVIGHDFHFGKGREGTPETMRAFCEAQGLGCEIVPVVEETGAAISSSANRSALSEGDIA